MPSTTTLEDYEVLGIIGGSIHSKRYRVKNKTNKEIFTWETVSYEKLTDSETIILLELIEEIRNIKHPYILELYDCINLKKVKTLYLVVRFCKYGNLQDLVQQCLKGNELLNEDFLWHVIYQTACALKLTRKYFTRLQLENIYIDDDLNIKLYNYSNILNRHEHSGGFEISELIYRLCSLKLDTLLKPDINNLPCCFSKKLKEFLLLILNDCCDVDSILCHPTVLLKSVKPKLDNIFIKNSAKPDHDSFENYHVRLTVLKQREMTLRMHEQELQEREHNLTRRERKMALMERIVKEKMAHAEVYLKRSRESKSSTCSSKTSSSNGKKINYEDLNTTLSAADCDQSVILPTTAKLDVRTVVKPSHFMRTMSERRIRFKGHSPLKDICNITRRTLCTADKLIQGPQVTSAFQCTNKVDMNVKLKNKKSRKLFARNNQEIDSKLEVAVEGCKRISWTEETKRHAFDLLRNMKNTENEETQIKHTYL